MTSASSGGVVASSGRMVSGAYAKRRSTARAVEPLYESVLPMHDPNVVWLSMTRGGARRSLIAYARDSLSAAATRIRRALIQWRGGAMAGMLTAGGRTERLRLHGTPMPKRAATETANAAQFYPKMEITRRQGTETARASRLARGRAASFATGRIAVDEVDEHRERVELLLAVRHVADDRSLLRPHRHHRVDARRATRWNESGEHRDEGQCDGHAGEGSEVRRADAVQQTRHDT